MLIELGGKLINPNRILSAELDTRHYMNGSRSFLLVSLEGGERLCLEHGYGFDAFATYDKLKAYSNG